MIFYQPALDGINSDGTIGEDKIKILLDNTPNSSHVTENNPTGSTQEKNIDACIQAYNLMKRADCLSSDDYATQQKVLDLEKVISFYERKNLPADHKIKKRLLEITKDIAQKKRGAIIEETFKNALIH